LDAVAVPLRHRRLDLLSLASQGAGKRGDKNLAATFPIMDFIFDSLSLPKPALPASSGVATQAFPPGFGAPMIVPSQAFLGQ
jgi:hypothetical protein